MSRKFLIAAMVSVLALGQAACGMTTVDAGNVGVKIKNGGTGTGVQKVPVGTGWQFTGIGERIVEYPVTQKVYTFKEGERIIFSDNTGLNLAADVSVTMRINGKFAPAIYEKYRLSDMELIYGPIRNSIRSAMNEEAERMSSEQIYQGGKTQLLQATLARVQKEYAGSGINILGLDWAGTIVYPESVMNAITLKTTKLQEAEAAKADEARAIAQANALVAQAKGEAEATRIRGEALRANPEILQQEWIAKWKGEVPSTVAGGNTGLMLQVPGR